MTADAVARRLTALRRTLQDEGVHAFVTAYPANVRYLTGFAGSNGLLWVEGGRAHLFT
ncbi:MAG: aminopeptidase P family N-terminal domain-containing protein, partial [Gemmatimonadota bacterium]